MNSNLYVRVSGMLGNEERTEVDEHLKAQRGVLVFGWRQIETGKCVGVCSYGQLPREIFITAAKTMRAIMGRKAFFWLMLGVLILPKRALKGVSGDE